MKLTIFISFFFLATMGFGAAQAKSHPSYSPTPESTVHVTHPSSRSQGHTGINAASNILASTQDTHTVKRRDLYSKAGGILGGIIGGIIILVGGICVAPCIYQRVKLFMVRLRGKEDEVIA